jgi:hypothetical protein
MEKTEYKLSQEERKKIDAVVERLTPDERARLDTLVLQQVTQFAHMGTLHLVRDGKCDEAERVVSQVAKRFANADAIAAARKLIISDYEFAEVKHRLSDPELVVNPEVVKNGLNPSLVKGANHYPESKCSVR